MNQLEFFDIPSPCIGVCTANSKGYCKGCLRSRDERIYWAKLSNEDRRKVIRLCAARKRKLLDAMRKNALATEQHITVQIDDLFN
ncbi:MAG: DUF1289 domain-containing protein [Neisseriaceae bacterium]|nr:DUF1289 domain-containing protein [Neisseriaceae bacterium]